MKYKTKARNYVAKHIGSLLFAVFRYSVKLYIWSIMHFHINILIIVSEIFSEECQTANILRWFIHLETGRCCKENTEGPICRNGPS